MANRLVKHIGRIGQEYILPMTPEEEPLAIVTNTPHFR